MKINNIEKKTWQKPKILYKKPFEKTSNWNPGLGSDGTSPGMMES